MKNILKQSLYGGLIVFFITVLGLAPVGQVFALKWGRLGVKMVEAGVIDQQKFEELYGTRGGMSEEMENMMNENVRNIKITPENSGMMLNMLWAFGLSNKNPILENGPMMDPSYGGADKFASTGGWTLAKGSVMDHYSMHKFVELTAKEQATVERAAKNIYRPCCKNSTYFPDCNHGMAMLGMLELMAKNGATEEDMYKAAEKVNGYWFPKAKKTGCGA